ncbi:beta strand repeat-containing protein, partial [Mucilaginibacter gotjawali]
MKNFLPKPTLVNRSELNQKFSSVYANGRKFGGFFGFAGILMVLFLCTGFTTNVKTFTRDKGTTKNKKIAEKKPVIFSDPAVGASVTFSCVSSSYIANSSTSSSSVSYTFTSPTDCDGIGFTAVDNTTGGGGTAGPRILVTSTHLLTFSRTSPATVTYGQLKSTSGAAFQLTGITIQTANVSNAQNITLSAYKGGVFVTGSNVVTAVPVQGTQAVINLSSSNFGSFYNNIDEIRVSTDNVAGNGLSITNITTASPVLPSTTITSLTKTGSSPTNASSVAYTATFAAAVTGLSTSDFSLTTSGVSGASVSSVSGSGTSWTVNVNTGSGDGSVVLKMSSSSGVSPSVSNVSFTGDTYAIDKTAPTVSSITATGTSPTNATSVGYTVTFAEAVTGVDGSDFTATTSGVSTTGIVVTPVSSSVYTVTVNGVSGTGSLRLDLKSSGTGIADLVGNAISGGFTSGGTYTIDQTAPTVSSITATGTSPTNGTSVGYTVTFAEAVTGVDGSDFTATTSGVSTTGIVVTPVSSSVYTVTVNGVSGTGSLRLDLKSSGTGIADLVGNAISGGFTSGGTYTIDQTAPTVSSITATGTSPTNGTSVGYTVTFAEAVTGVDGSDFTTTTSGVSTTGIVVTPVSSSVYTVTVNGVSGTGSLRLDLKSSGTGIADVAGNAITGGFTSGDSYSIDQTAPVVSSIAATGTSPTNATSVGYTVTFSKAVTGVDGSDFTATTSGVSTTGIVVTPVSSSVYTVTVNGVSGTGSLRLDLNGSGTGIADLVGNTISAGFTSGDTYSIDNTAPTLTSLIFSSGNANIAFAKNGDIVTLAFGANEAIQTPAVSIAGHIVTASNTGGNNYTASYTMTSGDSEGRIPFSLTVTDLAGNSGNYTDVAAGDDIEYDITSPTIAISAPSVSQIGAGGSGTVSYTVTYADANFNAGTLSTSAITLNSTGTATGTVGVSGSGTSYTVTISSISGAGTLGISIALGTASDLAGNTAPASGASGTFNVLSNDDNLTNLTISSGTLSPSFATGTLSYSVNVPYTVNSVTLTPTAEDINSTIDIGGNVISGNASGAQSLSVGANTINVTVTAQDGVTQNIYAVTVNRSPAAVDASLSNIQMSAGTLAPVFSPATTSYRVAVGNSFASITLMPTTTDPGATVKVNGTAVTSGSASPPIALKVGRDTITTTVKAQDGTTTKTYTVVVIR